MIKIALSAKTMEGFDAEDPQATVDIVSSDRGIKQTIVHKVIPNFTGELVINLDDPDTFPTWTVTLSLSRFDAGNPFTFMPRGEKNPSHTFNVARIPGKWTPEFTKLAALPAPRFDPFKAVVATSNDVDLKDRTWEGDLNAQYDALTAAEDQVLAKAALLNLFAVLSDEVDPVPETPVPWFSYVQKIVRIDQERFLAEVDVKLFESVGAIVKGLTTTFKGQGYFTEPPSDQALHIPNIPTMYDTDKNLKQMITVKKDYEQGNLQLTVSFLLVDDRPVHLLDCDMDENRNFLLHGFDLLAHLVDGGTNPIAMHEYIVLDSAQNSGGTSTIDLGYELV